MVAGYGRCRLAGVHMVTFVLGEHRRTYLASISAFGRRVTDPKPPFPIKQTRARASPPHTHQDTRPEMLYAYQGRRSTYYVVDMFHTMFCPAASEPPT